jgi:hypothetical protein
MSRKGWNTVLFAVGAWTLVGLLDVAKALLLATARGETPELGYLIAGNMPGWYGWALLTPLVAWLVSRYPLGPGWRRSVPVHAVASVLLGTSHLTASAVFFHRVVAYYRPPWFDPAATVGRTVGQFFDALFVVEVLEYWALVGVLTAWAFYDGARRKELLVERLRTEATRLQLVAADARLRSLRHELEPHFLFNALNAVGSLVRTGRGRDAVHVVALLGDLLRAALASEQPHEVTVRDEVALLGKYLEIQRVRFADRLSVLVRVEPDVEDALVPAFILQPLVENAVRHSLERHADCGSIEVRGRREGGVTELVVRDTGGPPRASGQDISYGVGISNTRERLLRLYGPAAAFELSHTGAGATTAVVKLPFHTLPVEPVPTGVDAAGP